MTLSVDDNVAKHSKHNLKEFVGLVAALTGFIGSVISASVSLYLCTRALLNLLVEAIEGDRYPLSPRVYAPPSRYRGTPGRREACAMNGQLRSHQGGYRMNRFGLPLAVGLLLFTGTAEASQQGQNVIRAWNAADKCAKQAQAAYPDYSAEANAKREAQLKACLSGSNLPPRQPLSQPPPR
jgi:hypothetical protein